MNKPVSFFSIIRLILICILAPFAVAVLFVFVFPLILIFGLFYSFFAPVRLRSTLLRFHRPNTGFPFGGTPPEHVAAEDEINVDCTVIHSEEVGEDHPEEQRKKTPSLPFSGNAQK